MFGLDIERFYAAPNAGPAPHETTSRFFPPQSTTRRLTTLPPPREGHLFGCEIERLKDWWTREYKYSSKELQRGLLLLSQAEEAGLRPLWTAKRGSSTPYHSVSVQKRNERGQRFKTNPSNGHATVRNELWKQESYDTAEDAMCRIAHIASKATVEQLLVAFPAASQRVNSTRSRCMH